jgi:hypothetical protein
MFQVDSWNSNPQIRKCEYEMMLSMGDKNVRDVSVLESLIRCTKFVIVPRSNAYDKAKNIELSKVFII